MDDLDKLGDLIEETLSVSDSSDKSLETKSQNSRFDSNDKILEKVDSLEVKIRRVDRELSAAISWMKGLKRKNYEIQASLVEIKKQCSDSSKEPFCPWVNSSDEWASGFSPPARDQVRRQLVFGPKPVIKTQTQE